MMQALLVALIVAACACYAAWTLMPSALRRAIAQRAVRLHWPEPIAVRLRRAAAAPAGCGCDGCDAGGKKAPASAGQPIRIHRRPPR